MQCRQCFHLSFIQLRGKHCQKPNCPNGVVDTFKPGQLSGGHWIEYSSSKFRFYNITKKIHVQHFWFRFRFLFSKDSFFITSLWVLKLYWRCSKNRYFSWLPYKKSSFLTFFKLNFSICSDLFSFFSFFFIVFDLMYIFSKKMSAALITWSRWASEAAYFKFSKLWNYLLSLSFLHLLATKPMAKQSRALGLSVSTTPITAMGFWQ